MDKALDVKILPPFGNVEEKDNSNTVYIALVIIVIGLILIAIIAEVVSRGKRNRKT